jgi:membrane associated rhomboid family serine protease
MLEHRDYMRPPDLAPQRSATVALLVVNAVAFVFQSALSHYAPRFPLDEYFALSLGGLGQWRIWQLLTFQFMHGGLMHLLLNCWAIYVFGRELEMSLGRRSYLTLYFSSGIVGGLFQVLGQLFLPGHFGGPVVGASAGVFGLVAAFARYYPERPLTLLLFFILPLTLRAKYLLWFSGLLAIYGVLIPADNVAHAAHLGGMLAGVFYVRHLSQGDGSLFRSLRRRVSQRELVNVAASKQPGWRSPPAEPVSSEEFISRQVDPILDKISAQGIQSLTERERQILEAARRKMDKR